MTINKQALRYAALHAKITSDWGCDADNFHDRATPDAVLSLLDELEAKGKRIAELEAREVVLPAAWWVKQGSQSLLAYEKGMLLDALTAAGIITKVGE